MRVERAVRAYMSVQQSPLSGAIGIHRRHARLLYARPEHDNRETAIARQTATNKADFRRLHHVVVPPSALSGDCWADIYAGTARSTRTPVVRLINDAAIFRG